MLYPFTMETSTVASDGTSPEMVIVPALAMSGNFSFGNRIKSTEGVVQGIRKNEKGYFVDVEFDEETP